MKLGAQFYTLREKNKTPEGLYNSFKEMKKIGYQVVQMSAICQIEAEKLLSYSEEFDLPITCTHSAFDRIVNDTDALIKEHKIYKCPVIGIGSMPQEYRKDVESVREFLKIVSEPMKKIEAAGLKFAYHNHAFEFDDLGGIRSYDILLEEAPTLNFILDTYWFKYANVNVFDYINKMGNARLSNVHFKDMKEAPQGPICPCGEGVIDFEPVVKICNDLKIPYALVEQDNAPALGDEYEQMATSFNNLKKYFF